jgi:hypothetical protein
MASAASRAYQSGSAFFGVFKMPHRFHPLRNLLVENEVNQARGQPVGNGQARLHYHLALPQNRRILRKDCSKFQPIRYALHQAATLQTL